MRFVLPVSLWLPSVAFGNVLPVSFTPHGGQSDAAYVARGGAASAILTVDGAAVAAGDRVVRMRFVDGVAEGWSPEQETAPSTFLAGGGAPPISSPSYGRVVAWDVWPGVDVAWHGRTGSLEYDLLVAPGADAGGVGVAFEGADGVSLDPTGDLLVHAGSVTLRQPSPIAWQEDGSRVPVRWTLDANGHAGFAVGDRDLTQTLTIDPVIVWEVQWTGPDTMDQGNEESLDVAIDTEGNSYVTGYTTSFDFPTTGGAPLQGIYDAFVVKLDPDGNIVWSFFLGGTEDEQGRGIGVDATGSAVVMGRTNSTDFPTVNAFQGSLSGGSDAFVVRVLPDGSDVVYSTYLGGSDWEIGDDGNVLFRLFNGDVDSDREGNAYVTGDTNSIDFPVSANAIQSTNGGGPCIPACEDAFAVKLDPDGVFLWGTYLGGELIDRGWGISVDRHSGEVVVNGEGSTTFPTTPGAFQEVSNGFDMFVSKISPDGDVLEWSTFLGGTSTEEPGNELAIDRNGAVYVTGRSLGGDYPTTPGSFQPNETPFGDWDAVVTKLSRQGAMLWSTYIGGIDDEVGYGIDVDRGGRVVITGQTTSGGTYPEVESFANCSGETFTMTELNRTGSRVTFSSCIPSGGFRGNALAIRGNSQIAAGSSHAGPGAVEATVLRVDDFLPGSSDLSVTQFDSPDPVPNELDDLTYTVSVENLGPDPALDVRLSGSIPDAVTPRTITSSQGTCSLSASASFCEIGTVDPGVVVTIEIVVSPSCTTPQPMVNTVEVSSATRDPDTTNNFSEEESRLSQAGC